jgi:hypothetical protein
MTGWITGVDHFTSDQSRNTDLEQDGKNGYLPHARRFSSMFDRFRPQLFDPSLILP